jgi:hypothetical protein
MQVPCPTSLAIRLSIRVSNLCFFYTYLLRAILGSRNQDLSSATKSGRSYQESPRPRNARGNIVLLLKGSKLPDQLKTLRTDQLLNARQALLTSNLLSQSPRPILYKEHFEGNRESKKSDDEHGNGMERCLRVKGNDLPRVRHLLLPRTIAS